MTQYNNRLRLELSNRTYDIEFRHGNYNARQFANEIINEVVLLSETLTVTYSSITNHYIFTKLGSTIKIFKDGTTCNTLIGIFFHDETEISGFETLESNFALDMSGLRVIHFVTNILARSNIDVENAAHEDILDSIPVNVPPTGLISYVPNNPNWVQVRNLNLQTINVRLMDELGNLIDMNGGEWYATITVQWQYTPSVQYIENPERLSLQGQR